MPMVIVAALVLKLFGPVHRNVYGPVPPAPDAVKVAEPPWHTTFVPGLMLQVTPGRTLTIKPCVPLTTPGKLSALICAVPLV